MEIKIDKIEEHLREFLMSDENCVTIEEARKEANERWPRSK